MFTFFGSAVLLFGLVVGSFLNVVTTRLAAGEPVFTLRSRCPACRRTLPFYDLVPVASFAWLRGRCRFCGVAISWQYPAVELATALLFMLVAISHRSPGTLPFIGAGSTAYGLTALWLLLRDLVFTAGLVALFVLDLRWYVVPDEVTLPLILFALAANLALGFAWTSLALGVFIGGGLYLSLWALSQGRWVGAGDIRLGALLGAMLGATGTLLALYLAYLIGGAVAVALLASGRKGLKGRLPMGTFLTTGAFFVMLFGDHLERWLTPFWP
jgi:prepilin signal peptidase PulO-like enzyme (type II secretory pathway)